MTAITVWKFMTLHGAERVFNKLPELQKANLIEIEDAPIVVWSEQEAVLKERFQAAA